MLAEQPVKSGVRSYGGLRKKSEKPKEASDSDSDGSKDEDEDKYIEDLENSLNY
jgi:hypothetical protein